MLQFCDNVLAFGVLPTAAYVLRLCGVKRAVGRLWHDRHWISIAPHPSACWQPRPAGRSAALASRQPGPTGTARCRWRCTGGRPSPPGTRTHTPPLRSAKATGSEVLPHRPPDARKPHHRCDVRPWQGPQTWVGAKAGFGCQTGAAVRFRAARHSVQGCHPAGVPYRQQRHTLALTLCACSAAQSHVKCTVTFPLH